MTPAPLVMLVPTRSRPHHVEPLARAFADTCTAMTWLVLCVDGCPRLADYHTAFAAAVDIYPRTLLHSGPRRRLVGTLNHYATLIATAGDPPFAIGYLGDDHRPRTPAWDTHYIDALRAPNGGIVYGDDRVQGASLPTQVAIRTDIINALGYMAPPVLTHMYCDNYWFDLGTGAGCLTYLPGVVVEHLHPSTGQSTWDASYRDSNSAGSYAVDKIAYDTFCIEGLAADIAGITHLRKDDA